MQDHLYRIIVYFIASVIVITLGVQVYWNYEKYITEKQELISDVQKCLDNSLELYYDQVSQLNTAHFFASDKTSVYAFKESEEFKRFYRRVDNDLIDLFTYFVAREEVNEGVLSVNGTSDIQPETITETQNNDPLETTEVKTEAPFADRNFFMEKKSGVLKDSTTGINYSYTIEGVDSLRVRTFFDQIMTSKNEVFRVYATGDVEDVDFSDIKTTITLTIKPNAINMGLLDSIVAKELARKRVLGGEYMLSFSESGDFSNADFSDYDLTVSRDELFFPTGSKLQISFNDAAQIILKRNLVGIVLSLLLLGAIISTLLFLLHIINQQKQLAQLKNDLISNITHEFKTPISTISVALEGLKSFNSKSDPERTGKYLDMSLRQVDKLNTMVEKILETATLDSDKLLLTKEEINLLPIVVNVIAKHKELAPHKIINLHTIGELFWYTGDAFHLENAINNVLDNAVKYGGKEIEVTLLRKQSTLELIISDSGTKLTKAQANKLFEKFYRVPKGNTHDVKGFGIGLFYTKNIVEKHGGSITVNTSSQTTFIITLPYV